MMAEHSISTPEINRRRLLGGIVAASAASAVAGGSVAIAATYEPAVAMTPRELVLWHIYELERLAKEDGADEAMIVVTGRFYAPKFHCKTLMLTHNGGMVDFNRSDFFAPKAVRS